MDRPTITAALASESDAWPAQRQTSCRRTEAPPFSRYSVVGLHIKSTKRKL